MVSVLSIEDGIKIVKMLDKSISDTFCMHDRSSGCGQCYPNFLLIRTVPNFPFAKVVRIIEVGLYLSYQILHACAQLMHKHVHNIILCSICICDCIPFFEMVPLVFTRLEKLGWLNDDRGTPTTLAAISVMCSQ